MGSQHDSNDPFHGDTARKMADSLSRIELRLVGDSLLGSKGLVQEVSQLSAEQKRTAEILDGVVTKLKELDSSRESHDRQIRALFASANDVKKAKRWVQVVLVIGPIVGGVAMWAYKSGLVTVNLPGL